MVQGALQPNIFFIFLRFGASPTCISLAALCSLIFSHISWRNPVLCFERIACCNLIHSGVGQSKLYDNAVSGDSRTASLSGGRNSSFQGGVWSLDIFLSGKRNSIKILMR